MMPHILQLFYALLGSVGFALLFNIRLKRLLPAALGGVLCWGVYLLLAYAFSLNTFFSTLGASLTGALYSEILARLLKAPTTVFLVPTMIPLIPGSTLFYTMQALVMNDTESARFNAVETLLFIGAIALGTTIISIIFAIITSLKKEKRL